MTPSMAILLVLACDQPADGTAVGNPGLDSSDLDEDGVLRLGLAADDALGVDLAALALDRVELLDCDGAQQDVAVGAELDLLDASPVVLPAGAWCQLDLRLLEVEEPLVLGGLTTGGTTWRVALDPGVLTVEETLYVDGQQVTADLDVDLLFSAAELEAMGAEVDIRVQDEQALAWSDALLDGVEADNLGDGAPADAAGASGSDAGCGCSSAGGSGWWVLAALAGLARRRRRGARSAPVAASVG